MLAIADRAEAYLKASGIADTAYFGPENEFFVFDDVKWHADMSGAGDHAAGNVTIEVNDTDLLGNELVDSALREAIFPLT